MRLTGEQISWFQNALWQFFADNGRHDMPWRLADQGGFDPYKIVVSELMLQQTQVSRAIPKYHKFLERFPDVQTLAAAPLGDVLVAWQGLGYNRRAKYLWEAAQLVAKDYNGEFPETIAELTMLPGIGKNTAGAVLAYAYNQPTIFIETNVRTVYIHHFFADAEQVPDSELSELLEQTLDESRPREFYWALMDYGSYLKQTVGNVSQRSKHHVRQSPFEGSKRQIRGAIIRALSIHAYNLEALVAHLDDERVKGILADLTREGLIAETAGTYHLA